MTSVQERLQLKRVPLDKWSVREQLCLASAVSCSGDQNWMSVSRSLKMLCGSNRPADWFSQKSCAVQYGELLENVETPKRKKRTASERDNQTAETPTESILRKLTQERVSELKGIIQQEQEDYAQMREDILALQNGTMDEAHLREMWSQIESEEEQKLLEKQKYEQWLKEREERKSELQRVTRPGLFQSAAQSKPSQLNLIVKAEEIDVDDSNSKQGTSPLLTSLLKSPATTPTASNSPTSIRITAPTITNLLTGNSTSSLAHSSTGTSQHFQIIQNQPLTGPVPAEGSAQVIPSPSQAAPTLSMLLENKITNKGSTSIINTDEIKTEETDNDAEAMETEDGSSSPNKDEEQQLMEVFNGIIPDNIDELAEILTNNNAMILNSELLEEESILENVDSLIDDQEDITDKSGTPDEQTIPELQNSKNLTDSSDITKLKEEIKQENEDSLDPNAIPKIEDSSGGGFQITTPISDDKKNPTDWNATSTATIEIAQDTDDSDNLDEKVKSSNEDTDDDVQIIEPMDAVEQKISLPVPKIGDSEKNSIISPDLDALENRESVDSNEAHLNAESKTEEMLVDEIMSSAEDESNNAEKKTENDQTGPVKVSNTHPSSVTDDTEMTINDLTMDDGPNNALIPDNNSTITIIDTDDDSPIEVIKEDKIGKAKRDYSRKKSDISDRKTEETTDENRLNLNVRKLKERDGSESPLVDDETSDSIPRTMRRYSSTPNSPASSDDREFKAWRKSILMVFSRISTHKYASILSRPVPDDSVSSYKQTILRPIDLSTIKRNIESGLIRTTAEFQRDIMLMCQNAVMFNSKDNNIYAMAKDLISETGILIENMMECSLRKETDIRSTPASVLNLKNRGRKSARLP